MNKRLIIAIAVVALCIVLAIVLGNILQRAEIPPIYLTLGLSIALIGIWIYLAWIVRKKKTKIFHDQVEPKLAERRLKRLKTTLMVAGISLAVGIVGVILHNVLYGINRIEEPVSFIMGIMGLFMFTISTTISWIMFFAGRR